MEHSSQEVTQWLRAWRDGNETALESLIPLIYEELRRLARRYMARQAPGHTLQTTSLINEAYVRLLGQRQVEWQNRAHFFAVCAKIMRGILVDHFRRRPQTVALSGASLASPCPDVDLLALNEALGRLEKLDERQSRVVEQRFFAGMTHEEVAEVLGVSVITVKRDWRRARRWLKAELGGSPGNDT